MAPPFRRPHPDASTDAFWDACREGEFLVKRCRSCGNAHFYPRPFCPRCWSDDVMWERTSGRATLYSWSVVHRNELEPFRELLPYVPALVDLAEGPRVMTRIVDADPATLTIEMPVRVCFLADDDGFTVPFFTPDRGEPQ